MISFLILCLTIIIKTNNINKAIPHNNFRKDRVKRNAQIDTYFDTDIVIDTMAPNFYVINVTGCYFRNDGLDLFIFSTPELNEDITLLITLYIDMYNDSLGYWITKEIDVRAYDYYGTGEIFSAYFDDLNLDIFTSDISLTVLNIIVESNSTINNYYVYFEEINYNFQKQLVLMIRLYQIITKLILILIIQISLIIQIYRHILVEEANPQGQYLQVL